MALDLGEIKMGFIGAGKMAHGIAQGILLVLQVVSVVVTSQHIIVSMAAGITIATLCGRHIGLLPTGSMVLRLMPNLPCVVQEGVLLLKVYMLAEAMAEGAVKTAAPSVLANRIAAQAVLGTGRLLRDSGPHPAQLRADVCTPGGTTIFGLNALERGGLRAAAMGAAEAAIEWARELGGK
ncbi:LOW QUALITY PROTEIN: pyrroline-5-carboxylate reductase 3 [Polyodon spathula]|uniref:LOW QUALITY PROTEIN: pyrroline-5-carboxylate reductase 3 n=1 Tax=Polyodon spathula TaxID=7913 RepID=UPI001B7E1960|nr:LOW QUALITY PROTEIN: pyrroline-5-carboxylate reductase 3 [Polyodon spathula]